MSIITIIELINKKGMQFTIDKLIPFYNMAKNKQDFEYYKSILLILTAGYNKKMTIELLSQIGV